MQQVYHNVVGSVIATAIFAAVAGFSQFVTSDPTTRVVLLVATAIVICIAMALPTLNQYIQVMAEKNRVLKEKNRMHAENSREKWKAFENQQTLSRDELIERIGQSLLSILHIARDVSVRHMPVPDGPYTPPETSNGRTLPDPRLEENRDIIINMLNGLVGIFREIAPNGTRVWASLRDRRADGCYHTFERAGTYSITRKVSSTPLHKLSRTVQELKLSYKTGSCVELTGSGLGESKWESHPNDKLGENVCVLMGAVMTKSPTGDLKGDDWTNAKLTWIVSVNADRPDAFNANHRDTMRCCMVAFSWLANTLIRKELLSKATSSASESKQGVAF